MGFSVKQNLWERLAASEKKRKLGNVLVIETKRSGDSRDLSRKLGEYTLYLTGFLYFKHTKLVVRVNYRHRLDKNSRARG